MKLKTRVELAALTLAHPEAFTPARNRCGGAATAGEQHHPSHEAAGTRGGSHISSLM